MITSAGIKLLEERYFLPGECNWAQLANRVSSIYEPIEEDIKDLAFLPSSPTLMNANTKGKRAGTLSSCFTMGIEDSIDGIMDSLKEAALVTKAAGGVGYVFSNLRSSGENIKSISRESSGPIPFMKVFNSLLDGMTQGGVRKGAGMCQFDIYHPDIVNVIRIKDKPGEMERLNISIRVPDSFYLDLKHCPDSPHYVVCSDGSSRELVIDGKVISTREIWRELVYHAWKNAEPGIFNSDIATRQCTVTNLDSEVLSNPCAEYVNIAYSSCNLGSINLVKCFNSLTGEFDWEIFQDLVQKATRFLNNVIDVNTFPIEKIKEVTLAVRPIGLGIMGWAHLLYLLDIPFNSDEANQLADELFYKLTMFSMMESIQIAKETGEAYPAYEYDLFVDANRRFFGKSNTYGIDTLSILSDLKVLGPANSCFTSIAPTGTISYIANASSGIEPGFALVYSRRIEKENKQYETVYITDPVFKSYLNSNFDDVTVNKILEEVSNNNGSCQSVKEISLSKRKVFVVASDLTPMEHLINMSYISKNISLSVSKTVNAPKDVTVEDISEIYLKAHELGIIGVTVFRSGSRDEILSASKPVANVTPSPSISLNNKAVTKRPRALSGATFQIPETSEENTYCTINYIEVEGTKKPWEIFISSSGRNSEWYAALGRLASRLMRKTGDVQGVIDELKHIGSNNGYLTKEYGYVESRPKHLGLIIEEFYHSLNGVEKDSMLQICPNCGEKTYRKEAGCGMCESCLYAACS